ncbi:MAG: hypothetical protein GY898_09160 [Proteobacteria bacterium]|nr:hypothetical protein [Pseudomonadota bacterium]
MRTLLGLLISLVLLPLSPAAASDYSWCIDAPEIVIGTPRAPGCNATGVEVPGCDRQARS